MDEFASLITRADQGDRGAEAEVFRLVYEELRRIAASQMVREAAPMTLQPTALVHEAWLRLGGDQQPSWESRAHFFGAAAEAMRRILIDRARRRKSRRHGGGLVRVTFDEAFALPSGADDDKLLAIHEALEKLARADPPKAELVKLRYFVGLTFEQAAAVLGIAVPTAKKWWAYARAWLLVELRGTAPDRE